MSSDVPGRQVSGRSHRIGAKEPLVSTHHFTVGTLDDHLKAQIRDKSILFDPMAGLDPSAVAKLGGKTVSPSDLHTGPFNPLVFQSGSEAPRCTAVRDLFAGTSEAGSVILTCGKAHHMDVHAHRMTNLDGSVTTWRN